MNKGTDFLSRIRYPITMNQYGPLENWEDRVLVARSVIEKKHNMQFKNDNEKQKVLRRFAYGMGNIKTARRVKQIIEEVSNQNKEKYVLKDFNDLLWSDEK